MPHDPRAPRGTYATVLLPIDAHDAIDHHLLDAQLTRLAESGVAGIYTNGTAGEFLAQDEGEFLDLSSRTVAACRRAGIACQIGVSHTAPRITLERIRATRALAPDAYQVILPDWTAPRPDEAAHFLRRVADVAEGVPLILYHPPFVRRPLPLDGLARLVDAVPDVIGLKLVDGGAEWYGALRRHLPHLSIFVPGHHLVTGLLQGAHGSYSNVACLSPRGAVALERLVSRDPLAALDLQRRINDFLQEAIAPWAARGYAGAALDKFLATIGGEIRVGTRLRWPYLGIPESEADPWRSRVREVLPELFAA
jgi:4-hydroxy-tetrahydrodipicolinate synthase